jgi:hypothetical protein
MKYMIRFAEQFNIDRDEVIFGFRMRTETLRYN